MQPLIADQKIKITVNGREIAVIQGQTLLQALLLEGVDIPHLCYDLRLERSIGNCGLCVVELAPENRDVKACQTPVLPGMQVITNSPKLKAYRKVRLEQLLSQHNADCVAPCVNTCPAHIDIQTYLRQVVNGNFEAALRVIKDRNPFPSVCGRVCPHPCEAECRRNLVDTPVAINHVKRFVSDWDMAQEKPWTPKQAAATGKKIAIVGSGPSGLSAAYYSAIFGHEVTVFERLPEAGGMMRYGIPEYRLPKKTLDAEIGVIQSLGVKLLTNKSLGTHIRLEDLQKTYDAVYLAIGSWRATPLQIEGETNEGVWLGIQYLEQVTRGVQLPQVDRVVVIGGGNTAIDCARTALRRGAKQVQLVYRRTKDEMPAASYEVEEAIHEGIEMLFLAAPNRIVKKDKSLELHAIRMELGEPDRSGRRRPVPIEGSDFVIETDAIIGAIGQSTNTRFLYNDLPVQLNKWGDIQINGKTQETSVEKVFAGGDCVTGPATVIQAVGVGRAAAESIHRFLTQGYVSEGVENYSCSRGRLEDLLRYEFDDIPKITRTKMPVRPPQSRNTDFGEVELGIGEAEARVEAARCMKCGCSERNHCELRQEATEHGIEHKPILEPLEYLPIVEDHPFIIRDHNKCISCGRCVAACSEIEGPDVLSLYIKRGRMLVGTKSGLPLKDTDCVSCGQCVNACPCGALEYRRERGKVFRALNNKNKRMVIGFVAPAVRSVISSHFGIPFDKSSAFLAGLLKRMGFDRVFDFTFAADLTIVEETTEFLRRAEEGRKFPQFTSCCPAWINFIERRYPELIQHLSTCKSPQQMMGATVKNHFPRWARLALERDDMFVVSIVPCLAKKFEAARPEFSPDGIRDVDAVLTTTELIEMTSLARIDSKDVEFAEFDEPYRQVSGAGMLFGATGGVAEAALRMAAEKVTGKEQRIDFEEVRGHKGFREAIVQMGDRKVRLAVIAGLKNAIPILDRLKEGKRMDYDLIEVMACPAGCIGGAGHPVPTRPGELYARYRVLLDIDRTSNLRKSHTNPDVLRLYDDFFDHAASPVAHKFLHTHYAPRPGDHDGDYVRNKAESTFRTREIEICMCDACTEKGSAKLFDTTSTHIHDARLEPMIEISLVRLSEEHPTDDVYVTLDGRHVSPNKLNPIYKLLKVG